MSHNRVKGLNGAAVTASGSRGGAVSESQPEQANEFQCVYMCDCVVVQPVTTCGDTVSLPERRDGLQSLDLRISSSVVIPGQFQGTTEKTLHLRFVMIRVVIKSLGGRFSDFKMGHSSLKFENSCAVGQN